MIGLYKTEQDDSIGKCKGLLINNSDIFNFSENKSKTLTDSFSLSSPSVQVGSAILGN